MSEVEKAFRYLQSGKSIGKMVIEMRKDDIVQVGAFELGRCLRLVFLKMGIDCSEYRIFIPLRGERHLRYIGCLGGIGRSIARWMTHRGAKNLILLSRSGPKTEAAMMLCKELKANGLHLEAPPCDVTKADSLSSVLAHCVQSMPPIKGCIQASIVLKV